MGKTKLRVLEAVIDKAPQVLALAIGACNGWRRRGKDTRLLLVGGVAVPRLVEKHPTDIGRFSAAYTAGFLLARVSRWTSTKVFTLEKSTFTKSTVDLIAAESPRKGTERRLHTLLPAFITAAWIGANFLYLKIKAQNRAEKERILASSSFEVEMGTKESLYFVPRETCGNAIPEHESQGLLIKESECDVFPDRNSVPVGEERQVIIRRRGSKTGDGLPTEVRMTIRIMDNVPLGQEETLPTGVPKQEGIVVVIPGAGASCSPNLTDLSSRYLYKTGIPKTVYFSLLEHESTYMDGKLLSLDTVQLNADWYKAAIHKLEEEKGIGPCQHTVGFSFGAAITAQMPIGKCKRNVFIEPPIGRKTLLQVGLQFFAAGPLTTPAEAIARSASWDPEKGSFSRQSGERPRDPWRYYEPPPSQAIAEALHSRFKAFPSPLQKILPHLPEAVAFLPRLLGPALAIQDGTEIPKEGLLVIGTDSLITKGGARKEFGITDNDLDLIRSGKQLTAERKKYIRKMMNDKGYSYLKLQILPNSTHMICNLSSALGDVIANYLNDKLDDQII